MKGLQDVGVALRLALVSYPSTGKMYASLTLPQGRGLDVLIGSEPSKDRVDHWTKLTGTPFDPFEAATLIAKREIACPRCRTIVHSRPSSGSFPCREPAKCLAAYASKTGRGYLQKDFCIRCTTCTFRIRRDGLAARKLANDLAGVNAITPASGVLAYAQLALGSFFTYLLSLQRNTLHGNQSNGSHACTECEK
jgi:DNA-directed RNA polymerase subunit RPC12/RpoP